MPPSPQWRLAAAVALSPAYRGRRAGRPPRAAPLLDARRRSRAGARLRAVAGADKVGEVRLIRRGDADVVQTLLYTKILARVVGEIGKKELANWPAGQPGHEDALRYVATLDEVQPADLEPQPPDESGADRRQKMRIEFVLAKNAAVVVVGALTTTEESGEVRAVQVEPIQSFEPSRRYAQRNMRLIAADSFQVEGAALDALLAPLPQLTNGEAR